MSKYVTDILREERFAIISVYEKDMQEFYEINIIREAPDEFFIYVLFRRGDSEQQKHFMIVLHNSIFPIERYMGQLLYTLRLPLDAWDHIASALLKLGPTDETIYSSRPRSLLT